MARDVVLAHQVGRHRPGSQGADFFEVVDDGFGALLRVSPAHGERQSLSVEDDQVEKLPTGVKS